MVFGLGNGGNSGFRVLSFDTSILADLFNARLAARTVQADPFAAAAQLNREPAVIPPWKVASEPQTLARRLSEARALNNFIDLKSSVVKSAGDNVDRRATFALFEALSNLQSLAQYAAEAATPEASLAAIDAKFRQGLGEVQAFLASAPLDKLKLMFGAKVNRVSTDVKIAKNTIDYVGKVIQTGARSDPLTGLSGNERFDITLSKSGASDIISIDLAQIAAPLTLESIVDYVNQRISAVPLLDANGNPVLDGSGYPVAKYLTRFAIETNAAGDHGIAVKGTLLETAKLSASDPDPALFVATNFTPVTTPGATFARLSRIDGVGGTAPALALRQDHAAVDTAQQALNAEVAAAAGKDGATATPVRSPTTAGGLAIDSEGFVYVVGTASGDFGAQRGDGAEDVYLSKFDSNGELVFTRLLGTAGADGTARGFAVTVDANDNVIIAGETDGKVASGDTLAGADSFVVKFNSRGDELFRYQLDSAGADSALALTTTASGDVLVAGTMRGGIGGGVAAQGGADAYVLRLSGATGAVLDRAQFGTAGEDAAAALAVASDGSVYLASTEAGRGIVRQLDGTNLGTVLASADLGSLAGGKLSAIAVEGGSVAVGGTTRTGALAGGAAVNGYAGDTDGFVTTFSAAGLAAQNTRFLGTSAGESVDALALEGGKIYVAGRTGGLLAGTARQGVTDAFTAKIDAATGAEEFVQQFGAFGGRTAVGGLGFSNTGAGVLAKLGLRAGTLQQSETRDIVSQTSVNDGDFFFVSINGGRPRKVTIKAGESMRSLAAKLNQLDFRGIKATVTAGSAGDKLEIKAQNGARIDLIAGDAGRDALRRLGLEPTQILSQELLFQLDEVNKKPEETLGGTFALGLDDSFNLRDKQTAKFVLGKIEGAIATVQRAFRSLTFDPVAYALRQQSRFAGEVPAFLTKQLAGYQEALLRLQLASLAPSQGVFT